MARVRVSGLLVGRVRAFAIAMARDGMREFVLHATVVVVFHVLVVTAGISL